MRKILYISSDIPSLNSTTLPMHDYSVIKYLKKRYQIYLLIAKTISINQKKEDLKKINLLKKKLKIKKIFLELKNKKITYMDKIFLTDNFVSPFINIGKKYETICEKYKINNCYVSTGKNSLEAAYNINNVKKICNAEQPFSLNYDIIKKSKNIFNSNKQIINPNRNIFYKLLANIWYLFFIRKVKKIDFNLLKNFSLIICHSANTIKFLNEEGIKCTYIPSFILKKKLVKKKLKKREFVIVANLSNQSSTSNFLSIHYLCNKLFPEIKRLYKGNDIKIVLLGNKSKDFDKKTLKILDDKMIINKGWVDDADLELQKSDLFLLCSNSYLQNQKSIIGNSEIYLSVAQSRIANVWANKVCLVAHSENKRCSLVLKHLDNCILASNPKSLAKWIIKLKNNSRLKHKIANNGYKTFKDKCQFKNYAQLLEKHLKIFV